MSNDLVRIECLRRRPPHGTEITLHGKAIRFTTDPESGREFAAVTREDADVLLRIDAYLEIDADGVRLGGTVPKVAKPAKPQADDAPLEPQAPATEQKPEDDTPTPPEPVSQTDIDTLTGDALRAEFERVVGRKPSPRAGDDTMRAQIKGAQAPATE